MDFPSPWDLDLNDLKPVQGSKAQLRHWCSGSKGLDLYCSASLMAVAEHTGMYP